MKYKIIILACLLVGRFAMCQTTGMVHLAWTPTVSTNAIGYNVYHSTNVVLELTNWTKIATITNAATTNVILYMNPGNHWFYLTSYDWWQESDPSNVAGTPPRPVGPIGVSIFRYGLTNSIP